MDLTWTDEEEAFRAEARTWLEENLARWHDREEGRRWLAPQRPEDVDDAGRVLHPSVRTLPLRPRAGAPPRAHLPARAPRPRRHHRAGLRPARRRRGFRRGVLRRRLPARRD